MKKLVGLTLVSLTACALAAVLSISVGVVVGARAQTMLNKQGMDKPGMGRGGMGRHRGQHRGKHRGNPVRHRVIMMGAGVPAPYKNAKNPLSADEANIRAGKAMFIEQCVSCHGFGGKGDGIAGKKLSPKPADLAFIINKPIATDPFLFWAISEGGEPLKTTMPAFKNILEDKQRWQIITYMRSTGWE